MITPVELLMVNKRDPLIMYTMGSLPISTSLADTCVTISPIGLVSSTSVLTIGLTNCGALSLIAFIRNSTLRDVDKVGLPLSTTCNVAVIVIFGCGLDVSILSLSIRAAVKISPEIESMENNSRFSG